MKSLFIKFNPIIYLRTFFQRDLCRISHESLPPNSKKANDLKKKKQQKTLRTTRYQPDKSIRLRPVVPSIKIIDLNRGRPKQKKKVPKPRKHAPCKMFLHLI